jgi:nucleoredoxin
VSTVEALDGKAVMIYFSAHWCPPCRRFTPMLVQSYNQMKAAGKNVEIVFARYV